MARRSPSGAALPFLKWAGGKGVIAARIAELLPADWRRRVYREPFLGGGAMFFHLRPKRAVLTDTLGDLIGAYVAVRDHVEALIPKLERLRERHDEAHFYAIRERFNAERDADPVDRAAWLIYLNKTCYNGLYRTNRKGAFNVPFGRYDQPGVVHPGRMREASLALRGADLRRADFDALLTEAKRGDVVYLDPPYDPVSRTASFSAYAGGFSTDEQRRLAEVFKKLDRRGCLLALSNNDTPLIRDLYAGFHCEPIAVPRMISAKGATRGTIQEVLIRNVEKYPKAGVHARTADRGA